MSSSPDPFHPTTFITVPDITIGVIVDIQDDINAKGFEPSAVDPGDEQATVGLSLWGCPACLLSNNGSHFTAGRVERSLASIRYSWNRVVHGRMRKSSC